MARDPGVDPGLAGHDVLRVDGEAGAELEAGLGGDRAQPLERGPGPLGVDVVGREGRDAAPVVDAGAEQGTALLEVHQVGRRLEPHLGSEDEAGDRDGGEVLVEAEVVDVAHRRVGLGAEVLDDDFLDVAVLARDPAQLEDRLGALGEVLADPDEQAGRERHREAAGVLEHPDADGGVLVRRAVVGLALLLEEPARGGLEHHPHRGGDRLEAVHLLPRHDAGVEVGQQPGLLEHPDRHRAQVGEGRVVALRVQPLLGLRPAVLGPVAEGEQRLGAAELRSLAGDVEDLVGGEVRRLAVPREVPGGRHEGAVVAAVATQPRDRDEHLRRVGDDAGAAGADESGVADPGGGSAQPFQVSPAGGEEHRGLVHVEGGARDRRVRAHDGSAGASARLSSALRLSVGRNGAAACPAPPAPTGERRDGW